ncbi:hypothetical protein [Pseudonocardia hydrocarbonoxydans]|uniref:hypothetical protein n=1 Tax=Pseudonocardia hydrocarbonoxydans TaxID=76726 RepID=UPI0031E190E7
MPRQTQQISIVVTLAGPQDTAVVAHRAGTDGAAISVRVGSALLYIHDASTANAFFRTWRLAAQKARTLPVRSDPTAVMSMAGRSEPAVMLDSAECPPRWAQFDATRRRLQVCMGRIVFTVNDHEALRSTFAAFRQADRLALTTFAPQPVDPAQAAGQIAIRALTPPAGSRGAGPAGVPRQEAAAAARRAPSVRTTIEGPIR